jgi:ATP adenylyltransferase
VSEDNDTATEASPEPIPAGVKPRFWTPWRMHYVAGATRRVGCIFCNRLADDDDVDSLILHRGADAFLIMNLYPYTTGHLMIVPNAHVALPEEADNATTYEMAVLRRPVLRAMRRALRCQGFNLGLNLGDVAGAGVTDHLHEHVVPRWQGDANFMPVLASTAVLPELIPVTYAKLRAELSREIDGKTDVSFVLLTDDHSMLVDADGDLPRATAQADEPLWKAAIRSACERGVQDVAVLGWAGEPRAGGGPTTLLLRGRLADGDLPPNCAVVDVDETLVHPDARASYTLDRVRSDRSDQTRQSE